MTDSQIAIEPDSTTDLAGRVDLPGYTSFAHLLVDATQEAADRCEQELEPPRWDETGKNEGVYCSKCAQELFPDSIDGGWTCEEDEPLFCNKCNVPLDYSLTDFGLADELYDIEENGITSDHDAYRMHVIMNAGGHPLLTERCGDWEYMPELKPRIQKIYEALA